MGLETDNCVIDSYMGPCSLLKDHFEPVIYAKDRGKVPNSCTDKKYCAARTVQIPEFKIGEIIVLIFSAPQHDCPEIFRGLSPEALFQDGLCFQFRTVRRLSN